MVPVVGVLTLTGLAWSQSAREERIVTVQELGKPAQKCRVLKTWTDKNGTKLCQVQSLSTNEMMTLEESGVTTNQPVAGTSVKARTTRIFHWGRDHTTPALGIPQAPPNATVISAPATPLPAGTGTVPASRSVVSSTPAPDKPVAEPAQASDWRQSWGKIERWVSSGVRRTNGTSTESPSQRSGLASAPAGSNTRVDLPHPKKDDEDPLMLPEKYTRVQIDKVPAKGREPKPIPMARRTVTPVSHKPPMEGTPPPGAPVVGPMPVGVPMPPPSVVSGGYPPPMQTGYQPVPRIVDRGTPAGMSNAFTQGGNARPVPADFGPPHYNNAFSDDAAHMMAEEVPGARSPFVMVPPTPAPVQPARAMAYQPGMMPPQMPYQPGMMPPQMAYQPPTMPPQMAYQPPMMPVQPVGATGFVPVGYPTQASDTPRLLATLRDSVLPSEREWAAERLRRCDWRTEPQVVQELLTAAQKDPAPMVRAGCVRTLGEMKVNTVPVVTALEGLKNDADPRVKHEVEQALSRLKKP
jgi:hypothetical protein